MKSRRRKRAGRLFILSTVIVIFIILIYSLWLQKVSQNEKNSKHQVSCEDDISVSDSEKDDEKDEKESETEEDSITKKLKKYAEKNHFSFNEYPEELVELIEKNTETEEFVLNYPLRKNTFSKEKLTELEEDEIPLLMQWDSRWGYYKYGDNVMGLTGCGPTCLSMVASYLFQDPELTPIYMADYATRNGYSVSGSGTSWDFMSAGARELGLRVNEVPLMENKIKNYLQQGYPIICILGPGEFTDKGHFIVLTGVENDKIRLNDPNSRERSKRLWEYEELKNQIRNIWVYQAGL